MLVGAYHIDEHNSVKTDGQNFTGNNYTEYTDFSCIDKISA